MSENTSIDDLYQKLDDYIDNIPYKKENLIGILHHAQKLFGFLPEKLQLHIAQKLDLPAAKIYGVVSFYSFFTMEPRGKHTAHICMGTACFVRGAEKLKDELEKQLGIKTGQATEDKLFSLDSLRCVGACGLAPVIMIDGKVQARIHKPVEVKEVLDKYREQD